MPPSFPPESPLVVPAALSSTAIPPFGVHAQLVHATRRQDVLLIGHEGGVRGVCIRCGAAAAHERRRRVHSATPMPPLLWLTGPLIWFIWGIYVLLTRKDAVIWIGYCAAHLRWRQRCTWGAASLMGALLALILHSMRPGNPVDGVVVLSGALCLAAVVACLAYLSLDYGSAEVDRQGRAQLKGVDPRCLAHVPPGEQTPDA